MRFQLEGFQRASALVGTFQPRRSRPLNMGTKPGSSAAWVRVREKARAQSSRVDFMWVGYGGGGEGLAVKVSWGK